MAAGELHIQSIIGMLKLGIKNRNKKNSFHPPTSCPKTFQGIQRDSQHQQAQEAKPCC